VTEQFINWDATIFPEPEKFKPERWVGSGPEVEQAKKLSIAFGLGNRTCVARE
jgi:cytochrome P450